MKAWISVGSLFLFHFVVQQVYPYLFDGTYPDLSCHPGYDIEEGKQDAKSAMLECTNRVKNYTSANVCMERCILHWIGILDKKSWAVRTAREIAIEFVRYTFFETKEGRVGATRLALEIHNQCFVTMEKLKAKSMLCKDWLPLYECVDKVWRCPEGKIDINEEPEVASAPEQ